MPADIARRLGVSYRTVRRHLNPPAPEPATIEPGRRLNRRNTHDLPEHRP